MPRPPRLLFATFHAQPDPASGAAVSARTLLGMLAGRGWEVWTVTGPLSDRPDAPPPGPADAAGFLRRLRARLDAWRPDVLLTYGTARVGRAVLDAAADRGVKVAFWLRNAAYHDPATFARCDLVLVPSRFTADFYRRRLGLRCAAIPSPIRWGRVRCDPAGAGAGAFVTFVNPEPAKGAGLVAGLAGELGRRRPDVRFLIVEGRGRAASLGGYGADLAAAVAAGTLRRLANTPDPRRFYARSRVVLVPSVWEETFGRTAAEAQINGLPVLASDRGGLPETVGDGGLVLPLPPGLTAAPHVAPPAAALGPWLTAVLRLWDDADWRADLSRRARTAAERFREGPLAARHDAALRTLLPPAHAAAGIRVTPGARVTPGLA